MSDDLKNIIGQIEEDLENKLSEAEKQLNKPSQAGPTHPDVILLADRLNYAMRAAQAHSQKMMPWRAGYKVDVDIAWCDEVCEAVKNNVGRPPHPDPDIEQALQDAFSS